MCNFLVIILRMLESFEKHFCVIFVSKLVDAGAILFNLVWRNVSWLRELNSQRDAQESVRKACLVTTGRSLSGFIRGVVVLQVLILNLKTFKRCYK